MGQWVVTVAGIAILSVLCDIVLPDGDTRKYVKTVVGIVVTLVMLQPIVNFVAKPTQQEITSSPNNELVIQQSYLDMVKDKQYNMQITIVKDILTARGIDIKDIKLEQSRKTIYLSINDFYSDKSLSTVNGVIKTYFSDYKISIDWKEQ